VHGYLNVVIPIDEGGHLTTLELEGAPTTNGKLRTRRFFLLTTIALFLAMADHRRPRVSLAPTCHIPSPSYTITIYHLYHVGIVC
jgi:hypothetical protein